MTDVIKGTLEELYRESVKGGHTKLDLKFEDKSRLNGLYIRSNLDREIRPGRYLEISYSSHLNTKILGAVKFDDEVFTHELGVREFISEIIFLLKRVVLWLVPIMIVTHGVNFVIFKYLGLPREYSTVLYKVVPVLFSVGYIASWIVEFRKIQNAMRVFNT